MSTFLLLVLSLLWGSITWLPCSRSLKVMKAEFQEAKRKLGTYIQKHGQFNSGTGLSTTFNHPNLFDPLWTHAVPKLPTIDFVFLELRSDRGKFYMFDLCTVILPSIPFFGHCFAKGNWSLCAGWSYQVRLPADAAPKSSLQLSFGDSDIFRFCTHLSSFWACQGVFASLWKRRRTRRLPPRPKQRPKPHRLTRLAKARKPRPLLRQSLRMRGGFAKSSMVNWPWAFERPYVPCEMVWHLLKRGCVDRGFRRLPWHLATVEKCWCFHIPHCCHCTAFRLGWSTTQTILPK